MLREPGGTEISERIREILLDRRHREMGQTTELLLFSASRAQLVDEVIVPALLRGEIVVCDRFYDSTTAYQGYGRGLDLETVERINRLVAGKARPDLTILIDVSVDEIESRMQRAGASADRMENSGRAFYERVRAGYQALCRREPDRCVCVDGMRPVDAIAEQIWIIVEEALHARSLLTQGKA